MPFKGIEDHSCSTSGYDMSTPGHYIYNIVLIILFEAVRSGLSIAWGVSAKRNDSPPGGIWNNGPSPQGSVPLERKKPAVV